MSSDPYMEKLNSIEAQIAEIHDAVTGGAPTPVAAFDYENDVWPLPTEAEFNAGPERLPVDITDTAGIGRCAQLGRDPKGKKAVGTYAELKEAYDWYASLGKTNPPYFLDAAKPYKTWPATTGAQQAIAILGPLMSPGFNFRQSFPSNLSAFNNYWLKDVATNLTFVPAIGEPGVA